MEVTELRDKLVRLRDLTVSAIKSKIKRYGQGRLHKEYDFCENGGPVAVLNSKGESGVIQIAGVNEDGDVFYVFVDPEGESKMTDSDDFTVESLFIILEQFQN